jgi:hypothetical protein
LFYLRGHARFAGSSHPRRRKGELLRRLGEAFLLDHRHERARLGKARAGMAPSILRESGKDRSDYSRLSNRPLRVHLALSRRSGAMSSSKPKLAVVIGSIPRSGSLNSRANAAISTSR